jgi:hypothetical protein
MKSGSPILHSTASSDVARILQQATFSQTGS